MNATPGTLRDTDMALRVPLEGVQLIEASAGTGKTYTIAGLYARLVVEKKLATRQILVMTFTKAATEELRQRLRQRLAVCARLASEPWFGRGNAPPAPLEGEQAWAWALLDAALREGGESAGELARRLREAVARMDEAAIFTIHGFCQRVLGEHAALIDGASETLSMEPSDDDLLASFAADAWLRWGASEDRAEREALKAFGADPSALADTLKRVVDFHGSVQPVPEPDGTADPATVGEGLAIAREALARCWTDTGDQAVEVFRQALQAGHLHAGTYKPESLDQLREMYRLLADGGSPEAKVLQKFSGEKIARSVKKDFPAFPGHAAFDAIDAWLQAELAREAYVRSRVPVVLHAVLDEARTWLAARKRDLGRMSYADQIAWVLGGLEDRARGENLRQVLRAQYPVALVDEFQDTDARQFGIFRRLYGESGALFCIGDPKQAIYGFRGGDVHAYLRARRLAAGRETLLRNFRSSPNLIAACDALFTGRADAFVEDGIAFDPVEAGGRVDNDALTFAGGTLPAMTLWRLPETAPDGGKDAIDALLASSCAGVIAQLLAPGGACLKDAPLQPASIAVLVDRNDQAMRMQDALAARGVPAVCQRRESVFATDEAIDLCHILDALLAPRHAGLARAALATRLLGRRLGDLAAMRDDAADWRGELDDLRARWLERGALAMIERIGERHAPRLLAASDGERCLSNLMQLGDAMQAEARRLYSVQAQRDWLARRMALADEHDEDEQLRLESDAERVQIMTIHASKGLEFDLVFMPFAASMQSSTPGKGQFARFHDDDDLVQRFIVSGSDARDPADQAAMDAAVRESLGEAVRKLYVGVTRARHACWLSIDAPQKKFAGRVLDWVLPDGTKAMLQHAKDAVVEQPLPEPAEVPRPVLAAPGELQSRQFDRVLERDWRRHSFTRLAEGGHADGFDIELPATPAGDQALVPALAGGLHGSRFGSAVHGILEQVDFPAWGDPGTALPETERAVVARVLAAEGFAGAAAQRGVEELLQRTLRTPVVDDQNLATLPSAQRRAEMEFDFGIAGVDPRELLALLHAHGYQRRREQFAHVGTRLAGLMNGKIDLVFVHGGRWWIADYKTNHLGERVDAYAPDALLRAVRESDYDLQYLIYTVALHRWLTQVRGGRYDYARDFGGVRYLFLRGMGVGPAGNGIFADRPAPELVGALDRLLHAPGVPS